MKILLACEELWVEVANYPAYMVSTLGRIKSRWRGNTGKYNTKWKHLKPRMGRRYLSIILCNNVSDHKTIVIHKLVVEGFLGAIEKGLCIRHLNGDSLDNRLVNLKVGTYSENEQDKRDHGTYWSRLGGAKLTPSDIVSIRKRSLAGASQKRIAEIYKVSRPTITRVLNRRTWGHI